ncbi:MAG: PIN domain-containing protein [Pseudomonadota bacterium]
MAERLDLAEALNRHQFVLLDTCVLINEVHGCSSVLGTINRPQRRASVLCLWEFTHGEAGAHLKRLEAVRRREWLADQGIIVVNLAGNCCQSFRSLECDEAAPPSAVDCLLAAEALARGWPLVTCNDKHFNGVPGLRLIAI